MKNENERNLERGPGDQDLAPRMLPRKRRKCPTVSVTAGLKGWFHRKRRKKRESKQREGEGERGLGITYKWNEFERDFFPPSRQDQPRTNHGPTKTSIGRPSFLPSGHLSWYLPPATVPATVLATSYTCSMCCASCEGLLLARGQRSVEQSTQRMTLFTPASTMRLLYPPVLPNPNHRHIGDGPTPWYSSYLIVSQRGALSLFIAPLQYYSP